MEAQGGPDQAPRQGEIWAAPSAVASVKISCATPPSTPPRPKRGILNRVPTSLHPLSPSTPPAQPTSTPGESAGAPAPGTDSPLKRGRRRLSLSKVAAVSPPRAGKEGDSTFGEQAWRKSKLESERATGLGDNQFAAAVNLLTYFLGLCSQKTYNSRAGPRRLHKITVHNEWCNELAIRKPKSYVSLITCAHDHARPDQTHPHLWSPTCAGQARVRT